MASASSAALLESFQAFAGKRESRGVPFIKGLFEASFKLSLGVLRGVWGFRIREPKGLERLLEG